VIRRPESLTGTRTTGGGFEYPLLLAVATAAQALLGAGALAFDTARGGSPAVVRQPA